ncbi:helix-turn-helix domain-containing protein [Tenacibaculum maritimum]|uniref:helix-turn-helix domain-containing protein n=1 Tax=Tenacibaculum maritimum TaxID=107401 RepID=UPI00388D1E53
MKYSKEQRKLIAKKAVEENNVAKISAEYGLNQSTVYRYIEKLSNNDNRKNHLSISFTDKEYEKLVSKAKDLGYEKTMLTT